MAKPPSAPKLLGLAHDANPRRRGRPPAWDEQVLELPNLEVMLGCRPLDGAAEKEHPLHGHSSPRAGGYTGQGLVDGRKDCPCGGKRPAGSWVCPICLKSRIDTPLAVLRTKAAIAERLSRRPEPKSRLVT